MKGDHQFIDALRVVLGLEPLYKQTPISRRPSYWRRAQADMLLASGDGNYRVHKCSVDASGRNIGLNPTDELEFRRKSRGPSLRGNHTLSGRRVGASFTRGA